MAHGGERLERQLGVLGATLLGLGSILGAGVFVSLGLAAGAAGPAVLVAILLAGGLAACNGLSSAQLAAAHPVAGGTYEYGHRLLHPAAGFAAGWMFLFAKSASAATAALGLAGYLVNALGAGDGPLRIAMAIGCVAAVAGLILAGLRRTSAANAAIVAVTVAALLAFAVAGAPAAMDPAAFRPFFAADAGPAGAARGLLQATALCFVAYTGYGRVATLGEEIADPRRNIPRAVVVTLAVTALLYLAVAAVAVGSAGAGGFAAATRGAAAPLALVSRNFPGDAVVTPLIVVGAVTALLGVLLNLLLGLSRVALAMGRRGEMPGALARLTPARTPAIAVGAVAALVAALALIGDVRTTWSLSAWTVLVYYGITNACALRLPPEARRYPRALAWIGLAGCFGLLSFLEPISIAAGAALLVAGLAWSRAARWLRLRRHSC